MPRRDVNFRSLFQDFNAPKLVVHSALLCFSVLFALKLDGDVDVSWWAVFAPVWMWKALAVVGASVGSFVWWRRPQNRLDAEEYIQYKAMLISLATHLLLLMFELMAADNLESAWAAAAAAPENGGAAVVRKPRHLWAIVFVPLVFVSVISVAVCIWSIRHDRSFELELFCAVNVLQFIFLPLKLDGFITWRWEVTFIPMWIVLCVSSIAVLYTILFAGILLRIPDVNTEHRRTSTNSALAHSILVIPLLVFLVLLTNKLDQTVQVRYFSVFSPLFLTFFTLAVASFGARGGNQYWFGLRRPPCQFLFWACPCLQLFGNISYSLYSNSSRRDVESTTTSASPSGGDASAMATIGGEGARDPAQQPQQAQNLQQQSHHLLWGSYNKKKLLKKSDQIVVPVLTLEVPD